MNQPAVAQHKNFFLGKTALPTILLLAFLLRVNGLGSTSIWTDEGISLLVANTNDFADFFNELLYWAQQPLYYLFLKFWIQLFGQAEFSIRFPSVLFGVLTALMAFKIGDRLLNRNVGLISALFVALSTYHTSYSQEARPYTLSTFLSLLSIYFFILILKEHNQKNKIWYVFVSSLVIYNHKTDAFIIVAQNIYFFIALLFKKSNLKINFTTWIFLQLIIVLSTLPWLIPFSMYIKKLGAFNYVFFIPKPTANSVIDTFIYYFSGSRTLFAIFMMLFAMSLIRPDNRDKIFLLVTILITPIAVLYIISIVWYPVYLIRYVLAASIAFYMLISYSISSLNRLTAAILLIVITTLSLLNVFDADNRYLLYPWREAQWKEVVSLIEKHASSEDLIIFDRGFCLKLVFNHYSKRKDLIKKGFNYKNTPILNEYTVKRFMRRVKRVKRIWLVKQYSRDFNSFLESNLSKNYKLKVSLPYKLIDVKLFEQK